MVYEKYIPGAPLREFVSNLVYYEGYDPEHSYDRFLPDGNTEMVIDLTDEPKYIYDNETLKEIQACHQVWVSGVRTDFITIPSGKESRMLIISFRRGRAYPFYPMPMNELVDSVVDADLVFGSPVVELRERLLASPDVVSMFLLVEQFLLHLAGERINPGTPQRCIHSAVRSIVAHPGTTRMQRLASQIGYSQKHFIELFRNHVGVTPKTYLRILRFQDAIQRIDRRIRIDLNDIAFESGYYDQAHFINDFGRFSGLTPGEYLNRKGLFPNYLPVT